MARRGKLTAVQITNLKSDGSYFDGSGLRLQVKGENKTWTLRFQLEGRRREMGLGSYSKGVSLSDAREDADRQLRLVRAGIDPIAKRISDRRRPDNGNVWTFDRCASKYIDSFSVSWTSKHHMEWVNSLATYASPVFADTSIDEIDVDLVMEVIQPLWRAHPTTASKVRGRIAKVLSWAIAKKHRSGPNPAAWADNLQALLPALKDTTTVQHLPSMEYKNIPAFFDELSRDPTISGCALMISILTACRTNEVRKAQWHEIDLDARIWAIPPSRMKMRREHRVPLSNQAIKVLKSLPTREGWVFPSIQYGKSICDVAMLRVLQRDMGYADLVVHGFRSSFSTWVAEETSFSADIREMALAHKQGNAIIEAYQRGDLLAKRRRLMDAWGNYCNRETADVVLLHAGGQ